MIDGRADPPSASLPTGTVTFLFTDIEGSTRLIQELGQAYGAVLDRHRAIVGDVARSNGGATFGSEGDALFIAFPDAAGAIAAAAAAQSALQNESWSDGLTVRVRMGIHSGDAVLSGGDYVGLALHQVARITSAAHGEQVLVSETSRALAASALPVGVTLRDLGEHRLKDLARPERLHQLLAAGLRSDFPPPRTLSTRPNNLPVVPTSFVGRGEIETARRLQVASRLLTLTGPGGTGKTRLALQLAAEAMDDHPDGVFFVELDLVDDARLVPSAIAQALNVDVGSSPPLDRLIAYLRDKRILLVLDNFEQVVEAADVVGRLLREAPDLRVIVTSRVVLRIYGEQEFPVPPLELPPADPRAPVEDVARSEAVRLFVERAMASVPAFRLDETNTPAVAEIVTRLDGLPLAIELAAARLRLLPVEALRNRLDQKLTMLTGGARDLPARQQTLRGAIDWSFDLLEEPDRRLFARLAVFAGGVCLAEAETVCGPASELGQDVLDGLTSLVEKSLIRSVPGTSDEPRFAMLATIREYGLERLDAGPEAVEIRRRHAAAYLALVEGIASSLTGPQGGPWLDRLALDHDNLRAAIDWAIAGGEAETAYRLGTAIWRFWQLRGHLDEANLRFPQLLATAGGDDLPPAVRSRALGAAGGIQYWRADVSEMRRLYDLSLDAARASGDKGLLAESLYNLGFAIRPEPGATKEELREARAPWEESLALFTELGDLRGEANANWALAIAAMRAGEPAEARLRLERSRRLNTERNDPFGLAWVLHMMGLLDAMEGDRPAALKAFAEALRLFVAADDRSGILLVTLDFAVTARLEGDWPRHWRLMGAADELRRSTGTGLVDSPFFPDLDWRLADRPTDEAAERAWTEGARMPLEALVAYALELAPLDT